MLSTSTACQSPPPVLQLQKLAHHYGRLRVLRDVTLNVNQGESICIYGPSGCGKSTLLRLIAGIEPLKQGRISINGTVVADGERQHLPPEARQVGLMLQDYALFSHLTIRKNIAFGLPRRTRAQHRLQVDQLLARFTMQDLAERYPHTLSIGQQQRVALLRALAPQPKVLLLDEPLSALDRHLRESFCQEIQALLCQLQITTLMVTHEVEEAMLFADRIVILNQGHVVQSGSPHAIYTKPKAAFVVGLFSSVNTFQTVVQAGRVATAIGVFPAHQFADNTAVQVLVRASDIEVCPFATVAGSGIAATVRKASLMGMMVALQLVVDGDELNTIRAHIVEKAPYATQIATPNARVSLSVCSERVLVFPSETAK